MTRRLIVIAAACLIIVRLATAVNAVSASVGDRFQGYLDLDLSTNGRLVTPRGSHVYGTVTAVDRGHRTLSVTLNDLMVGGHVLPISTQPLNAPSGGIRAQSPQAFTLAMPFQVDVMTNVAVR